jgi:O-antigen ligase
VLSIFWSDDPALTFRHCTVLLFCGLGILGISRQVTLRDLCLIALCGLSAFVFYSIGLEISQGTFRPFSPDYRFAGTLHPNAQAPNCAIMALSAAFLARHAKRGRLLLWTLCLIGVAMLLLTKSRTVCGAVLVSVLIYKALGQPLGKKTLATVIMLWAVSTVALASTVVDWNFEDQAVNVALIGRQDEAESLSGRIPLWTELLPYISEHPIVGHGYMTFWTPQRVSTFTHNLQWTVPDGHCAYLDMLLELGLVGISICALTIIVSFAELRRRIFAGGDFGYAFFFIILACRVLNGFLESAFAVPTTFVAFIVACGLSHLALGEMPNHILETDEVPT